MAKKTPPKDIALSTDARQAFAKGIDRLTETVACTLGPDGNVVVMEHPHSGPPFITKDGVTVARSIAFEDPVENQAAQAVIQAAHSAAQETGDGTTTATIYAQAIYRGGLKRVESGANVPALRRGINAAVDLVRDFYDQHSQKTETHDQFKAVATCSANQDQEVGRILAEVMDALGKDCQQVIEPSPNEETRWEPVDGLWFDRGLMWADFINTPDTREARLSKPRILVTTQELVGQESIVDLLGKVIGAQDGRPLLILAENVAGYCLSAILTNVKKGSLYCVPVRPPYYGDRRRDLLDDLAVAVGATVLTKESGQTLKTVTLGHLGEADEVIVGERMTRIIGGNCSPQALEARIAYLNNRLAEAADQQQAEEIKERISRLSGGMAKIYVGGRTDTERQERRDLVEDAMHAVKAAAEEGWLPGGAVSPLRARAALVQIKGSEDELAGVQVVREALVAPFTRLVQNCGGNPGGLLSKIEESDDFNLGYNGITKQLCNLVEANVLVPTKVERVALQAAASVAMQLLSTGAAVTFIPQEELVAVGPPQKQGR